jgi:hypothetical protein
MSAALALAFAATISSKVAAVIPPALTIRTVCVTAS